MRGAYICPFLLRIVSEDTLSKAYRLVERVFPADCPQFIIVTLSDSCSWSRRVDEYTRSFQQLAKFIPQLRDYIFYNRI